MKVLFDHQIFINQRVGGISRYITDLKSGFDNLPEMNCQIIAYLSNNVYLNQKNRKSFKLPKRAARALNSFLIKEKYSNEADIIHPTYYNIKYLAKTKKPIIITVHDLIYFKYSQYFSDFRKIEKYFSFAIKRCDGIICISENTKRELSKYFDVSDKKVTVIHHGLSLNNYQQSVLPTKSGQDYFLYVGSRHLYKNFNILLEAFPKFIKEYPRCRLIVVGGESPSEVEQAIFNKYSKEIEYISCVSDVDLLVLYRNSKALIITSLDEGFCYPAVEALLAGTEVICTDIGVLREVIGNRANYIDGCNSDSLFETMVSVIERGGNRLIEIDDSFISYYKLERMCDETKQFYNSFK